MATETPRTNARALRSLLIIVRELALDLEPDDRAAVSDAALDLAHALDSTLGRRGERD